MKIGHLADMHLRGLTRHDEVRAAVEAFCADGRKRRLDHIVIAGDLWHTKSLGITAEYIELMTWVLRSMADVAMVHIVLGNHDGILGNLSRQDAVTPIVEAIADPRVNLYKQSGTYQLEEGVNLCVFSVFDLDGWSTTLAVPDEYNIAVYHGPVAGAQTEAGWKLDAPVDVGWFVRRNFDLILLGDIHARQFLAYREQP